MKHKRHQQWASLFFCVIAATMCVAQAGCITTAKNAVPADRLPAVFRTPPKSHQVPINLALLRQDPPDTYIIGPGDVLGVFVHGVIPARLEDATPIIQARGMQENNYYPPKGNLNAPNIGLPILVQPDGTLNLPLVEPLPVEGLTLPEVADALRKTYEDKGVIQPDRQRVFVSLVKPRVVRVLVIREPIEDESQPAEDLARVLDLPAFENDVLHALVASGGLPRLDLHKEVWVLRSTMLAARLDETQLRVNGGEGVENVVNDLKSQSTAVRIPLWNDPHAPLPFGPQDIILRDGDVVFVQRRIEEVFYTGGLLGGRQIPLPRDHDVDVIEAIALAGGSIGAPGGSAQVVFRAGAGPGNLIPATRAMVIRKLPNGQQLAIRIDLNKALRDPKHRILIQPEDLLMLNFKPEEIMGNALLNLFDLQLNVNDLFK